MGVCTFGICTKMPISQMSDRAVCAIDSHVYFGCTFHGLHLDYVCTHSLPCFRGQLADAEIKLRYEAV
jgi:hypothetical protein